MDATEAVDETNVEEIAEAAVVVVGEVDGVATETALVGSAGASELEVWIENESSCSLSCLVLRAADWQSVAEKHS